ncbi:MAG: hypothetical protein MK183_09410 [Verrucomicrobiales bacterium]|nr:hypothetical protein [Verrucomicrobiales bacterium]
MNADCPLLQKISCQFCMVYEAGSSSSFDLLARHDSYGMGLARFLSKVAGSGLADLPPPGEMPAIGKAPALIGFYRVNTAQVVFQEGASAVFILLEGKAGTGYTKPGVVLDKVLFS